jgi:hypothetical protein
MSEEELFVGYPMTSTDRLIIVSCVLTVLLVCPLAMYLILKP